MDPGGTSNDWKFPAARVSLREMMRTIYLLGMGLFIAGAAWADEAAVIQAHTPQGEEMAMAKEETTHATNTVVSGGVVHALPADLREALLADREVLRYWEDITPLARNEWICWVETPKQTETRKTHIRRLQEELKEGKRRPCCWPGCPHRAKTGK